MAAQPSVSVVVPAYRARGTIERCLESLRSQSPDADAEVIVVVSSSDGTAELIEERFPEVVLERRAERLYPGEARNVGVAAARGAIVAFTDADCVVPPGWIDGLLAAHERHGPIVGGALENGSPASYVAWGYHLGAYSRWLPGPRVELLPDLATGCLSVERHVLEECGPFGGSYSSDTAFSWRAARRGHALVFDPSVSVAHANVDRLGAFVRRRLVQGRAFAAMRAEEQGFGAARAALHAVASPLLPPLLFARVVRNVLVRRRHLRELLLTAPLVLAGCCLWSAGEAAGYAARVARVAAGRAPALARGAVDG